MYPLLPLVSRNGKDWDLAHPKITHIVIKLFLTVTTLDEVMKKHGRRMFSHCQGEKIKPNCLPVSDCTNVYLSVVEMVF